MFPIKSSISSAMLAMLVLAPTANADAKSLAQAAQSKLHQAELQRREKLRKIAKDPVKAQKKAEAKAVGSAIKGVKNGLNAGKSLVTGNVVGGAMKGAAAFGNGANVIRHANCAALAQRATRTGTTKGSRFDPTGFACR